MRDGMASPSVESMMCSDLEGLLGEPRANAPSMGKILNSHFGLRRVDLGDRNLANWLKGASQLLVSQAKELPGIVRRMGNNVAISVHHVSFVL